MRSLTVRLFIYFLSIAIPPLLIIGYIVYHVTESTMISAIHERLSTVCELRIVNIERYFNEMLDDVSNLSKNPLLTSAVEELTQTVTSSGYNTSEYDSVRKEVMLYIDRLLSDPKYSGVRILNPNGEIVYSNCDAKEIGSKLLSGEMQGSNLAESIKRTATDKLSHLSDFGRYNMTSNETIFLTIPILKASSLVAILAVSINPVELNKITSNYTGLGSSGESILVSRSGPDVIYITPLRFTKDAVFKKVLPYGVGQALRQAAYGGHGSGAYIDYRGKAVICSWAAIPLNGWGILVKIDRDEVFKTFYNQRGFLILAGLLSVVFTIFVILYASRLTSFFLYRLSEAAETCGLNEDVRFTSISALNALFERIITAIKEIEAHLTQRIKEKDRQILEIERSIDSVQEIGQFGDLSWDASLNRLQPSQPARIILGLNNHDLTLEDLLNTLHPDDREPLNKILLDTIGDDGRFEIDLRMNDRSVRYLHIRGRASYGIVRCVVFDISEWKSAELAVKEKTAILLHAQNDLVRKEKLSILGQMTCSIGNELKKPLGVIEKIVSTLRGRDKELDNGCTLIENETRNMENIISTLLDFTRRKRQGQEEVVIAEIIDGLLASYNMPKDIRCELTLASNLPVITIDTSHFKSIIKNIIDNAIDAMPDGGHLKIESYKSGSKDKTVVIRIEDSGTGMDEEVLSIAFQPLFTTKPHGIGLGLNIVRNLVEVNGGKVYIDSAIGKGTVVTIEFVLI